MNMADIQMDHTLASIGIGDINNPHINFKNNNEFKSIFNTNFLKESGNIYTADTAIKPSELIYYLIHEKFSEKIKCHHCNSSDVILFGKARGKQRHMCKTCGRTFTILTNTPLSGTHYLEKWGDFLACMLKGMTLHASENEIKVSYVTLFYWRHKILSILKNIKPKEMNGVVELDDIYVNYSKKGQSKGVNAKDFSEVKKRIHRKSNSFFTFEDDKVCVIAAADNFSNVFSKIACVGRLEKESIEESVGMLISSKNQVCFNHKTAYYSFSKKRHLKLFVKNIYSAKPARSYTIKCMKWMHRFLGVATSYLNNYLGWFKFLFDINFDETEASVKRLIGTICL